MEDRPPEYEGGSPPQNKGKQVKMKEKLPLLLLVEDNEDDVLLTLRALRGLNVANRVEVARDGAEAIDFLTGEGKFADRDTSDAPQFIMLDLNLPKLSRLEVLRKVRELPIGRTMPVIMLTTSKQEGDMKQAYELGANSYVTKPVESDSFKSAIDSLGMYWLAVNTPPPKPRI